LLFVLSLLFVSGFFPLPELQILLFSAGAGLGYHLQAQPNQLSSVYADRRAL
jgi:hypothetical protein